ncbi:hypothetical protein P7C73_g3863, partial [Tremellales sp. Uapishka_1]
PRPPPPRSDINPTLIQRVNQAASQHPWLSVLIQKAARSEASKDELGKLGRVVARLREGKDVGEGATVAGPTAPSVLPPTQTGPARPKESDDESEVDMKGPKQVGGGPKPSAGLGGDISPMSELSSLPDSPLPAVAALPSRPAPQAGAQVRPPSQPTVPPPPAKTVPPAAPSANKASSGPPAPQPTSARPPIPQPPAPPVYRPPPPPPRPTYPLPPPFLLVAFKDSPTEKYLLPLGSLSFVSRIGGDVVTNPPPPPQPVPVPEAKPVVPESSETAVIIAPEISVPSTPARGKGKAKARGKGRTRLSMGRKSKAEAAVEVEAVEAPEEEDIVMEEKGEEPAKPKRELPPLPGATPAKGTVLMSTFLPAGPWDKPIWEKLEKRLPYNNPAFLAKPLIPPTPNSEAPANDSAQARSPSAPMSPSMSLRQLKPVPKPPKTSLLNLGSEDFLPDSGGLHPITLKLGDVSDRTWYKIRTVMELIDREELKVLAEEEKESLLPAPDGEAKDKLMQTIARLREMLAQRKKETFKHLASIMGQTAVPPRKFLRYRVEDAPSDIQEATADRFAPRPYVLSTKYQSAPSPPPEDLAPQPKKRRVEEPTVTFEMPMSFDELDQNVEKSALGKVAKTKRVGKRGRDGRTCEGCAGTMLKVWRRGPGGKGTLCNACGDKFLQGVLGPLKAPGAAKKEEGPKEEVAAGPSSGGPNDNPPATSAEENASDLADPPIISLPEDKTAQKGTEAVGPTTTASSIPLATDGPGPVPTLQAQSTEVAPIPESPIAAESAAETKIPAVEAATPADGSTESAESMV